MVNYPTDITFRETRDILKYVQGEANPQIGSVFNYGQLLHKHTAFIFLQGSLFADIINTFSNNKVYFARYLLGLFLAIPT
jgi:hypothetical protein